MWNQLTLWPVVVGLVVGFVAVLVTWHTRRYGYTCPTCGLTFKISYSENLKGPHIPTEDGGQKLLKCPGCHEKVWARMAAVTKGGKP